jgi:hypothetical protein
MPRAFLMICALTTLALPATAQRPEFEAFSQCDGVRSGPGRMCVERQQARPPELHFSQMLPVSIPCGDGYCRGGLVWSRTQKCMDPRNVDCGDYSCRSGSRCSRTGSCVAIGAVECGNGTCNIGDKCVGYGQCQATSSTQAFTKTVDIFEHMRPFGKQIEPAPLMSQGLTLSEATGQNQMSIPTGQNTSGVSSVPKFDSPPPEENSSKSARLQTLGALGDKAPTSESNPREVQPTQPPVPPFETHYYRNSPQTFGQRIINGWNAQADKVRSILMGKYQSQP